MAFIYNLTDSWTDAATTWNGIKLAVTNTASSASSNLLNLTVTGATTASFVVDKSGNLALNGTVNKVTITAPATAATLTLADNSTFITSGAYSSTFTFTGATTLTFPTSGTVTALGNTTTGSGAIVLASSPTLVTPALGTPSSATLTNATGLPLSTGVTGTLAIANGGTGQTTANAAFNALVPSQGGNSGKYLTTDGSNTSWATNPLGTVTSVDVSGGSTGLSFSGGPITTSGTITMAGTLAVANGGTGITSFGTGVATALGQNVTGSGGIVLATSPTLVTPNLGTPSTATLTNATGLPISTGVDGLGANVATFLATPSSANLASAVTDETGSGPLVFATSPRFTSQVTFGTSSSTRGTLVLANTSANTVTLQSSNSTAANYTLTFPAAAPVNGYYLQTDVNGVLSWAAGGGGGGGSPGGSNTQVQFNDSATFGGEAAFTYDKTTYTLGLGVASTTTGTFNLYNSVSANAVSLKSGNNSAPWTLTLPTSGGTNNYVLTTNGSGTTSWTNPTALGVDLDVGTTAITGGTSGRVLYDNAGVLGELAITGTGNAVLATSPTITTPTISGNETHTGTGALFLADFSNVTVASRFAFQTSTTNATTGIYALPNGSSQGASWQAANAADPTNASKILITTNASTDVQLVSGINGTGTYLPLSIYTGGGVSAQFSATKGIFTLGVSGSTAGVLNIAGSTSGTVSIQGAAGAGTYNFNLPTSAGTSGQPLLSGGGGATSMTFGTLGVSGGGTGASSAGITAFNNITGYTAAGATGTTSTNLVFSTSPTLATPRVAGSSTGYTTLASANSSATNYTLTLPAATGTVSTTGFAVAMSVVFGG